MHKDLFIHDPVEERGRLLHLAGALTAVAVVLWLIRGEYGFPAVIFGLAVLALTGRLAYRWIGRGVYLFFAAIVFVIGSVISRIILVLTYVFGIVLFGSIYRVFGMDVLKKDFAKAKALETAFEDTPETTPESFRRQS